MGQMGTRIINRWKRTSYATSAGEEWVGGWVATITSKYDRYSNATEPFSPERALQPFVVSQIGLRESRRWLEGSSELPQRTCHSWSSQGAP